MELCNFSLFQETIALVSGSKPLMSSDHIPTQYRGKIKRTPNGWPTFLTPEAKFPMRALLSTKFGT